jgi:hypothetical protein
VEPPAAQERAEQVSDAALIEGSLRDPGCFAAIFDRHGDAIMRYACARVGRDLAEDVTAETFLAAFGRRGHYDISRDDARAVALRHRGPPDRQAPARRCQAPADAWGGPGRAVHR